LVNKPESSAIRLSPSEIAQRHKDDKCFKCNELFTPGHRQHCKQILVIEVVDDATMTAGEPTISLHVLIGIQPRAGHTMQIAITINEMGLLALLDMGSTHNFIDTDKAAKVGVVLSGVRDLHVAVANGDRLTSPGCCHAMPMSVHGELFHIDCYDLTLGSYDMVLDV
jgi:hypothetical protein